MSSASGPNYSVDNQISFIVQWFRTWSELQKDDFVEILAHKLAAKAVNNMNGLVNGMQKLDTGSKRVSLFSCQIKLFNEWWPTWSDTEKDNLTSRLKESDSKFWNTVQEELNGTRKRLEDDFFLTINTNATSCVTMNGTNENGQIDGEEEEVVQEEDEVEDIVPSSLPQQLQEVQPLMNGNDDEGVHDKDDDDMLEEQDDQNISPIVLQNGIRNGEPGEVDEEDNRDEGMEDDGPSG